MTPLEARLRLAANDYSPIPARGKIPHCKGWPDWKHREPDVIRQWDLGYKDHQNTSILTYEAPFLDIDIYDQAAAQAVEELVADKFDGYVLPLRFGQLPKRGFLFQISGEPFAKIIDPLIPPTGDDGKKHGAEFLCDGNQVVVHGDHPEAGYPYRWHKGSPFEIKRADLLGMTGEMARLLHSSVTDMLIGDFRYQRAKAKPRAFDFKGSHAAFDWSAIHHDPLDHDAMRDTIMAMMVAGMKDGAIHNFFQPWIENAPGDEDRRNRRRDELIGMIRGARAKLDAKTTTGATAGKGYPFITADDALDISKNWVVKKVLASEEVSSFIGPPGAAKSALLTDIAVHTASYPLWRSYKIKENRAVLYWALERGMLVKRRLAAYKQRDAIEKLPIAVVPRVIDLLDRRCALDICDTIKAVEDHFGIAVALVVFDTYSKGIAAGGGEENSARDQNIVAANMRRVLERMPIHISGVGHTGKDETRGERGSNAHLADVDMQAMINGGDAIRTVNIIKANDQDTAPLTSFALERVDLGVDEDGEEIATMIVAAEEMPAFAAAKKGRPPMDAAVAFSALQLCIAENGVQISTRGAASKIGTTVDEWKRYFRMRSVEASKDNKIFEQKFHRAVNKLQATEHIEVWNDKVWIIKQ